MGIIYIYYPKDLELRQQVTEQTKFASAEEVTEEKFSAVLKENKSLKRISAIVVDESYTVNVDGKIVRG